MTTFALRFLALTSLGALTLACSEPGVIGIHAVLDDTGGGTVTVRALHVPEKASSVETQIEGAVLEQRVDLHCMHGTFESLDNLKVGDIEFAAGQNSAGMRYVRVTFPRGKNVRWPTLLAPSPKQRLSAERAFAAEKDPGKAARTLTLTLELPRPPVGHGVSPRMRGTSSEAEGRIVTMLLPIDAANTEGRPIVWDLTYNEQ